MAREPKLHKNVFLMGLTSFFTDVSSEMVYPLLQAFMSMVRASHKAMRGPVLGVIEGIAESTASLGKVVFGYYSDRIALFWLSLTGVLSLPLCSSGRPGPIF